MQEQKESLSERELEILRLVATGAPNKEIARILVISPNTVKVHMRNIFAKIGVASRTEATLYAINIGLIKPGPEETISQEETNTPEVTAAFDSARSTSPGQSQPGKSKIRQIGLIILAATLLLSGSIAGIRLLNPQVESAVTNDPAQAPESVELRWEQKEPLPAPRKAMGAIEYENAFYLFGGETDQGIDGSVLRYDLEKSLWESLIEKPTPVTEARAELLGEKVYIPGGLLANGQTTDILEVYDPRNATWSSKASLPVPLSSYAMTSFEGRLYLFGGKNGDQYSDMVYSYDPEADLWQEHGELPSARAYAGAAAINGKIFIIGGFDGKQALKSTYAYFPNRDISGETAWEECASLQSGRYGMGVTQIATMIFLAGGKGDNVRSLSDPAILQYKSAADEWAEVAAPSGVPGAFPVLLSSGDFLYVIGGETSQGLSDSNLAYQAVYTISVPLISKEK